MNVLVRALGVVAVGLSGCGCLAVRTGDGRAEAYGKRTETVRAASVSSVETEAVRADFGATIVFTAKGEFTVDATVSVAEDDRWLSFGICPGLEKPNTGLKLWTVLLVNVCFFGYPTIGSLLIEPFCEPAPPGEWHIADPGLVGCCKYVGARYPVEPRDIPAPQTRLSRMPLGGFDAEIAGEIVHVGDDGEIQRPGMRRGERVAVTVLSCPQSPEGVAEREAVSALVGRTLEVVCR